MQETNINELLKAIGDTEITQKEMHTLKWLFGFEIESIDNICSVIEKVKNKH